MFKKISLFALAFAFIGLTGCAEGDETTIEDADTDAEVVTPVEPADEMMNDMEEDMDEMGDDMEAGMDEMGDDMEAVGEEMEEEIDEMDGE